MKSGKVTVSGKNEISKTPRWGGCKVADYSTIFTTPTKSLIIDLNQNL